MTNIVKNGAIIRTSKDLRAMLDYARVSPVVRIESCPIGAEGGTVRVLYHDGAESRANFACYRIMVDWMRRRRSWRGALHVMQRPDTGYLTRP